MVEAEPQETRIEKLEIQQEEAEAEVDFIEQTIQQVNSMETELPSRSTARDELHLFKQKLEKQKEANEQIVEEIKSSIEHIRGY